MSLLFADGFDGYGVTTDKYLLAISGDNPNPSLAAGRNGSYGLYLGGNAFFVYTRNLNVNAQTVWVGCAYSNVSASGLRILRLQTWGTDYISLYSVTGGALRVYRGDSVGGTILGTTVTGVLNMTGWNYIEMKVYIHDTAGTVDLWVDGINKLSLTSQDTKNGTDAYVNILAIGGKDNSQGNTQKCDDLYVTDDQGAAPLNGRLGDCRIEALLPNGAGDSSQFTPSAGSNYENVDERVIDNDTTYNESSTTGHKDLYAMSNLAGTSGSILAVVPWVRAKKTDGGGRTIRALVKHSTSEGQGATIAATDGYIYQLTPDVFPNNPSTASAWTPTEVNAMQAGLEIMS